MTSTRARMPSSCLAARRCRSTGSSASRPAGCPHSSIREDASVNLAAVAELEARFPKLENRHRRIGGRQPWPATFYAGACGPDDLRHRRRRGGQDSAEGGGRGFAAAICSSSTRSTWLRMSGPNLEVMRRDTIRMRGERPFRMISSASRRRGRGDADMGAIAVRPITHADFVTPPEFAAFRLAADPDGPDRRPRPRNSSTTATAFGWAAAISRSRSACCRRSGSRPTSRGCSISSIRRRASSTATAISCG